MQNGIKTFAMLATTFMGLLLTNASIQPVSAAMVQCGCGDVGCQGGCLGRRVRARATCGTCQTDCGCVQCPKCEGDMCKLELDKSKVKKTCFKVEQKTICVPAVRLPWAKCPPARSKTKLISVLKTHTYECPGCSYKWSLEKPAAAPAAEPGKPAVGAPQIDDQYAPPATPVQGWSNLGSPPVAPAVDYTAPPSAGSVMQPRTIPRSIPRATGGVRTQPRGN